MFSKFRVGKMKYHTVDPLEKIFSVVPGKIHYFPPLLKILPTPMVVGFGREGRGVRSPVF